MLVIQYFGAMAVATLFCASFARPFTETKHPYKRSVIVEKNNLAASPKTNQAPKKRDHIMPHIVASPPITPSLLPDASDVVLMPNGVPSSVATSVHNFFRQHPNHYHASNLAGSRLPLGYLGPHHDPHFEHTDESLLPHLTTLSGARIGVLHPHAPDLGSQIYMGGFRYGPLYGSHSSPYYRPRGHPHYRHHHYRPHVAQRVRPHYGLHVGPNVVPVMQMDPHNQGDYQVPGTGIVVPRTVLEEEGLDPSVNLIGDNSPGTVFLGGAPSTALANHYGASREAAYHAALLRERALRAHQLYLQHLHANPYYKH